MKIVAQLHTTQHCGDHFRDVTVSLDVDENCTLKDISNLVFNEGIKSGNTYDQSLLVGDKRVDFISLRILN